MEIRRPKWALLKNAMEAVLPKGRFARSVGVLAGGAALGQAITVLISPILTRIYSPDDFGVFGVYASILGVITAVAILRYDYAIPLPEDDETAANVLALCFMLLLGITVVSWFVIQGLGRQIVAWANASDLERYLWLLPLGMLGAGVYKILNYWAVRKRNFVRIARTRISRGVARAALQVGAGFANSGPLGLMLGQLAGETAGSVSLGLAAWRKNHSPFKSITLQGIRKGGWRYRRFPLFSSWASLINRLGIYLPQLLFASFYGIEVAGWFVLGQQVIESPLNLVGDSVAQVYFGEAALLSKTNPSSMKRQFLRLTLGLALTGGLLIVGICALAPLFFTIVFGPAWKTAGQYVQLFGLMYAVRFVVVPLSHILSILERQELQLSWDGMRLILVVGALLASKNLGFPHFHAVMTYSLSMSIAYVGLWGISWYALLKKCGHSVMP